MNVKGFWKPDAATLAALAHGAKVIRKHKAAYARARNVRRSKGRV